MQKKIFKEYIRTNDLLFRYAGGVHEPYRKESHCQHEIFFLCSGEAEMVSESGRKKLCPYAVVVIPKETFHQFINNGKDEDYHRCVFKIGEMKEYDELIQRIFQKVLILRDKELTELFMKLRRLSLSDRAESGKAILCKAYLAEILVEIGEKMKEQLDIDPFLSPVTREAILYINRNVDGDLSLKVLSTKIHISTSYLCSLFKKDMNVSIHSYILEKRLMLANEKISNGIIPAIAASESGFRDYSNFYQQYKKRFGVAPSQSKHIQPFV